MPKGPTIKLYNSDGVAVEGNVTMTITDYGYNAEYTNKGINVGWNQKLPTEPGMYLFRRKNTNEIPVCCILKDCMLSMYQLGDNKLHITDVVNCEWYGPILGL